MISSNLLTKQILMPFWHRFFLFLSFYFITFYFCSFNNDCIVANCAQSSESETGSRECLSLTIPQEEFIIKCIRTAQEQDLIIKKQQTQIQELTKAVDGQILFLYWTVFGILAYELIKSFM